MHVILCVSSYLELLYVSLINKEETQGYIADYERRLAEMTDEATEYMDDYQMVLSFIEK